MIIDPLDHQEHMRWRDWDELEWGMRHQSVARFVLANHDALAFVASQDKGTPVDTSG